MSLIRHWKMNDNAATSAVVESASSSGTKHYSDDGVEGNTNTVTAAGKINTSLDFSGDNYVRQDTDLDWSVSIESNL